MSLESQNDYVLAGDIGGTTTRLGLFTAGEKRPVLKIWRTYSSREHRSLEEIITDFLQQYPVIIVSACFGAAGPVIKGRCRVTNLPWIISESRIKKQFQWPRLKLINDQTALALAIPFLSGRELFPLNRVRRKKGLNIGLVAPGTGLGQALLIGQEGEYRPVPSEGGHVDFAPTNEEEIELWRFLQPRYGHVSVERVLSGPGLGDIYSWLKQKGPYKEPAWLGQELSQGDPPQVIAETALARRALICEKALEVYISILGAVSGNLALTALTTGGVYLGGGIPPRIRPALQNGTFMRSFVDKGRFKIILENIPVKVIMNDKAALLGAARCAEDMITKGRKGENTKNKSEGDENGKKDSIGYG